MARATFPYVNRVKIKNFRSIQDMDVELPPFAVLVGPNGAGKTNFVQALSLLGQLIQRGSTEPAELFGWSDLIRRQRRRARQLTLGATVQLSGQNLRIEGRESPPKEPAQISVEITLKASKDDFVQVCSEAIHISMGENSLAVRIEGGKVSVDYSGDPMLSLVLTGGRTGIDTSLKALINSASQSGASEGVKAAIADYFALGSLAHDKERRYLRLLSVHRFYSPLLSLVVSACSVERIRLDATALRLNSQAKGNMSGSGEGLAASVAGIRGMGPKPRRGFEPILEALQEIFPRIEDVMPIRVGPNQLALTLKEEGVSEPFAQSSLSDGVLHALALLVGLRPGRPRLPGTGRGILAIEEPENAIHPWSIRVLMKSLQERQKRQILLTTHSTEVIAQVVDPSSLLICEFTGAGTKITPALAKESALKAILRESGQDLGEIWRSGLVGGIPGPTQ